MRSLVVLHPPWLRSGVRLRSRKGAELVGPVRLGRCLLLSVDGACLHEDLFIPPRQPMEIYVDDEAKLTLHGLVQHYIMLNEDEKNRKLNDLLDALDFNQVCMPVVHRFCWWFVYRVAHVRDRW